MKPFKGELLKKLNEEGLVFEWIRKMPEAELEKKLYPFYVLKGNHQRPDFHPEGDVAEHTIQAGNAGSLLIDEQFRHLQGIKSKILLSILGHDFGKDVSAAIDPKNGYPIHPKHEALGVPIVEKFLVSLDLEEWIRFVSFMTENHGKMHSLANMGVNKIISFAREVEEIVGLDAFIIVTSADFLGRVPSGENFLEGLKRDSEGKLLLHPAANLLRLALVVEDNTPLDTTIKLTEEEIEKIPEKIRSERILHSKLLGKQKKEREEKIRTAIETEKDFLRSITLD